jgi:LacI family transcriptional regulator
VGEVAVEILVGQLQQHSYGLPALPTITMVEGTWRDGDSLPQRIAARSA